MWYFIYIYIYKHTMPLQIFLRIRSALCLLRHSKCNEFGLKSAVSMMRRGGRRIRFGNAVSGHLKGKRDSYSIQILQIYVSHKIKHVILMYCITRYYSFLNTLKAYNLESDFLCI
jgi:hypothetical protein